MKVSDIQKMQKQAELKQLEVMAKMDRLNLGLLTDDRDTCSAEGNGLLAQLQRKSEYNIHFKTNTSFYVPQEIRITSKHPSKCVITVSPNKVKIAPAEPIEPATFNTNTTNGQNIDIRHEKQINNGREEKVVIISISSSR